MIRTKELAKGNTTRDLAGINNFILDRTKHGNSTGVNFQKYI